MNESGLMMSGYPNEEEQGKIIDTQAGAADIMENARDAANAAANDVAQKAVPVGQQQAVQNQALGETPSQTSARKPTYTNEEMVGLFKSGSNYSQGELDAMSDEEYGRYQQVGKAYFDANPTPKMKQQRMNDRLDAAERLSKMAKFVADETRDDPEFAKKYGVTDYSADWLANHPSSFAKMKDEDAMKVANGIQSAYDEASKRRGHLRTFVDSLKRGQSGFEKMLYQGGSALFGDGGNTEESRAIQRQTEIDDIANPQKIGSTANIHSFGDALDFMLESTGENIQRTAFGIGAATAGGLLGGVPGAVIAGSLGTMTLNTGEAVGDQLDEMAKDEDMRYSRGWALAQGTGYSILDGAFGIVPGLGKVWGKALQMAGKEIGKKAELEIAKDIAGRAGLKKFLLNLGKTVGEEAIQEPAQSQIIGRARRFGQTGSALTKEEEAERAKGNSPVWRAVLDEALGGASAALLTGGIGGAVDSANASRQKKIFDGIAQTLGQEELFQKMDPVTQMLVAMRVADDRMLATKGVWSEKELAEVEKRRAEIWGENADGKGGYIGDMAQSGNDAKKLMANTAMQYVNVLESQYTNLTTDQAVAEAKAKNIGTEVDSDLTKWKSENKQYSDGSSADVYTDPKTGIQMAHKKAADGIDEGWLVLNSSERKSPMEDSTFDTEAKAVAYAQKLDLLNKVRDNETAGKKQFIENVYRKLYGNRAAPLRFVDRPNAENDADRIPSGALAAYDPAMNVVRIATDQVKSLGELYTVLAHERFHEDIADYIKSELGAVPTNEEEARRYGEAYRQKKEELFGGENVAGAKKLYDADKNYYVGGRAGETSEQGVARFGEELTAERSSVNDLVKQLRSANRGAVTALAMKIGNAVGLKMAEDMGVAPELITSKDVADEIGHLWRNGYTGIEAEVQRPTENAELNPEGMSINDYILQQKGEGVSETAAPTVAPEAAPSAAPTVETVNPAETATAETVSPTEETVAETPENDGMEAYFSAHQQLVEENGHTYIDEADADEFARRNPDYDRGDANDGAVKFTKKAEAAPKAENPATAASDEVKADNVVVDGKKPSEAVSAAPVESPVATESQKVSQGETAHTVTEVKPTESTEEKKPETTEKPVEEKPKADVKPAAAEDTALLDAMLDGGKTVGVETEDKDYTDDDLQDEPVGELTKRQQKFVDRAVKDLEKMRFKIGKVKVFPVSVDVRYSKDGKKAVIVSTLPDAREFRNVIDLAQADVAKKRESNGPTDAQIVAASIPDPLKGKMKKRMTASKFLDMARTAIGDERHSESSLRKFVDRFKEYAGNENNFVDQITWRKSGMKDEFMKLVDDAETRIIKIGQERKERNAINLNADEKDRAEMFRWWMANDPRAESSWLGAFIGESGKFGGIFGGSVPKIEWARDGNWNLYARWANADVDSVSARDIFDVETDRYGKPKIVARDDDYAKFYSMFMFGMSPKKALEHSSASNVLAADTLIMERISDYLGATGGTTDDLNAKYDGSDVVSRLLDEYNSVHKAWEAHKRGEDELSVKDMIEADNEKREWEERLLQADLDAELPQMYEDRLAAEADWARQDEEITKQILSDIASGIFKTKAERRQYVSDVLYAAGLSPMMKTSSDTVELTPDQKENKRREDEKAYVRYLGRDLKAPVGSSFRTRAESELYRLYVEGENENGGIDKWIRSEYGKLYGNIGDDKDVSDLVTEVWNRFLRFVDDPKNRGYFDTHTPEGIIGNAVKNVVRDFKRYGLSLGHRGGLNKVAVSIDAMVNDKGEPIQIRRDNSHENHIRRFEQRKALITLREMCRNMSEDRAMIIDAWLWAKDRAYANLETVENEKGDDSRDIRDDKLWNDTARMAAGHLSMPSGVYRNLFKTLLVEMEDAFGNGRGTWSDTVKPGSDWIMVDPIDMDFTTEELVEMMMDDYHFDKDMYQMPNPRPDMAFAVECADMGLENDAIASAWNEWKRSSVERVAKDDPAAAKKLTKSPADIRALLSKARTEFGWRDEREVRGNKSQTNMDLDVAENASDVEVKDFATQKLRMGLSESRVSKMVAEKFGMEPMAAANAVSKANAARTRKQKGKTSVQGDLFGTMTGKVEKPKTLSYQDQMRVIRNAVNEGKTNDEIAKMADKSWTMDEAKIREKTDEVRAKVAEDDRRAEFIAMAQISRQEAAAREEEARMANVKTYKVGDVALLPVNDTKGLSVPKEWDGDRKHRLAYRVVRNAVRQGRDEKVTTEAVSQMYGIPKIEAGRLFESMRREMRSDRTGNIRSMVENGMSDEDVVKAVVKQYGVSETVARRDLDSAKRNAEAVAKAEETKRVVGKGVDMTHRFGNATTLASSEARSKFGEDKLAKRDAEYWEEQRQASEDREFKTLMDLYDGNLYRVLEELKNRGRDKKRISGVFRRNVEAEDYGEIVKTAEVALPGDFGLTKEQSKSDERRFVDKVMEGVDGDALMGLQSLRSRGLTQAKAEKLVRDWGRRHMKPVNLTAAKRKAEDAKLSQELFGDLFGGSMAKTAAKADDLVNGMYSKLLRTVTEDRQQKYSAQSLVPFLKGRGVKDEEIKSTGLEAFLDGKKSVTKDEIVDWVKSHAYVLERNESRRETYDEKAGKFVRDVNGSPTKYFQWSLPGGSNYREVLFEDPNVTWKNPHWDSPHVVAHTRLNDFDAVNDADVVRDKNGLGEPFGFTPDDKPRLGKVLFVEEMQSDLHQSGRDKGYEDDSIKKQRESRLRFVNNLLNGRVPTDQNDNQMVFDGFEDLADATREMTEEENERYADILESEDPIGEALGKYPSAPDVPYKKTWHEYVMKQNIREASENGYDYVAWTTGAMQAERYGLEKLLNGIKWFSKTSETGLKDGIKHVEAHAKDGGTLDLYVRTSDGTIVGGRFSGESLSVAIGKQMADRILTEDEGVASGDDLRYGNGEGMRNFYDVGGKSEQNIPKFVQKYIRQWGGKLEEVTLSNGEKVTGFRITPEMRSSVLDLGQPMFKTRSEPKLDGTATESDPSVFFPTKDGILDKTGTWLDFKRIGNRETFDRGALDALDPAKLNGVIDRAERGEGMSALDIATLAHAAAAKVAENMGVMNTMNALNGKARAGEAEESAQAQDRIFEALRKAGHSAGSALEALKVGIALSGARDTYYYLASEAKATMAKQGLDPVLTDDAKAMLAQQAEKLAKANEEIAKLNGTIAELNAKAEKMAAELAADDVRRGMAEPFRMTAEARSKLSSKYGFKVTDSDVEAANVLARLAGIAPKNVMAKTGDTAPLRMTDEIRECFGQIVSSADFDYGKAKAFVRDTLGGSDAYDALFDEYRAENERETLTLEPETAKRTVRAKSETHRKGFVRRHPKGKVAQMPLGLTLGGLQDRLDHERRNCISTMKECADTDERTKALGRYLRRFFAVKVAEGVTSNDEIFRLVGEEARKLAPDMEFTDQDVYRVIAAAKGFDPATKAEIGRRMDVLKKALRLAREGRLEEAAALAGVSARSESQLLQDAENALKSEYERRNRELDEILANPLPSDEEQAKRVKELRDEINETVDAIRKLRDEHTANEKKDYVLNILNGRLAKLKTALAAERTAKDWQTALTPDAERARSRIRRLEFDKAALSAELLSMRRDVNLLKALQRQIDEYQRRIEENDFEPAPKKVKPNVESYAKDVQEKMRERDALRKRFKAERERYQYRKLSKPAQALYDLASILGETKAIVGSMDFSSVLRQGGQLTWAHPVLAAKNIRRMWGVFADEKKAQNAMDEIMSRPNSKYYQLAGVEFTDWGVGAQNADDRFLLNHYRRITQNKYVKMGVEASERAFSMYLNFMRADVFDRLVASSTAGDASELTNSQLRALGNFINIASQRGAIDKGSDLGKAVPAMNYALWSPRNMISRFQFLWNTQKILNPFANPYGDKTLRGLFAKELVRYMGGVASAIAFTKVMADLLRGDDEPSEDLELDPRSTNFLTVKLGNTHVDFLSGLKQVVVFSSRVLSGKQKNARGQMSDVRSYPELFGRFARSKLSPGFGYVYDLVTGETFERQDLKWLSLANNKDEKGVVWHTLQQVVPLTFTDLYEQAKLSGIPRTVITSVGTILGAGVQAYDPYTFKNLSGDYGYFKKLYLGTTDEGERKRLMEQHPMLRNMGPIEAQLKYVRKIQSDMRKMEKAGVPTGEMADLLDREQKVAVNLMAGFKNPTQVD